MSETLLRHLDFIRFLSRCNICIFSLLNSNKIGNKDNLISMLVANAKNVEDCLTQTTESGVYRWYSAKNQPSTGGYMIVFKYHSGVSMRLALTDSGAYYSTYQAGVTYGSWEKL